MTSGATTTAAATTAATFTAATTPHTVCGIGISRSGSRRKSALAIGALARESER
jgi:hypothetical protein